MIKGMDIWVVSIQNAMDMPECLSMAEIQQASSQDDHLQQLKCFINAGWSDSRDKLHADLRPYWLYRDELVVIDGIILKGRCIIMPNSLRQQVLSQLYTNHMRIEKTKLLAHESVYWSNINADIKIHKTMCYVSWISADAAKGKVNPPWHTTPAMGSSQSRHILISITKNYLCVVDCNSKFPVIKWLEGLSAENFINTIKIIFTEYDISRKIMSDAGTNFVSNRFWQFWKTINVEQAVSLAYHHQSNRTCESLYQIYKMYI